MIERSEFKNLQISQLLALALYTEEYNIHFFRSWANRLRPYDSEAVELLADLANDAKQYRNTLYDASKRLFPLGLPELEPEQYIAVSRNLELPDYRYFVVSDKESRSILNAALALQKDTIALLTLVDKALHDKHEMNLLSGMEQNLAATTAEPEFSDTEKVGPVSPRQWQS